MTRKLLVLVFSLLLSSAVLSQEQVITYDTPNLPEDLKHRENAPLALFFIEEVNEKCRAKLRQNQEGDFPNLELDSFFMEQAKLSAKRFSEGNVAEDPELLDNIKNASTGENRRYEFSDIVVLPVAANLDQSLINITRTFFAQRSGMFREGANRAGLAFFKKKTKEGNWIYTGVVIIGKTNPVNDREPPEHPLPERLLKEQCSYEKINVLNVKQFFELEDEYFAVLSFK